MSPKELADSTQLTVRVPSDWAATLDELASRMAPLGMTLSRTDVVRAAIGLGIERLQERYVAREGTAEPTVAKSDTRKKR